MWSYPNLIPLDDATIADIARRVERFSFERVYGGWWGRTVVQDGAGVVRRSADRYIARLHGQRPNPVNSPIHGFTAVPSRTGVMALNPCATASRSAAKWGSGPDGSDLALSPPGEN
jgi:hypothetical protein